MQFFPGALKYEIESQKYEKNGDDDKDGGYDEDDEADDDDDDNDCDNEHDKSVIDTDSKLAKSLPSNIKNVRQEATVLVDNVLEQSIHIVNVQQDRDHIETYNVVDNYTRAEYNSESENYAITCDDVDGLDVIKSPTIESMSGKSFDDNLSFTDEHIPTVAAPATILTSHSEQQAQEQIQMSYSPPHGGDEMSGTNFTTTQTSVAKGKKLYILLGMKYFINTNTSIHTHVHIIIQMTHF